jgi:mRNA interferase HigB
VICEIFFNFVKYIFSMVVISKGIVHVFASKRPMAVSALNDWYNKTKNANWKNGAEVKKTFNSVDAIGNDRYIFNISGNNYRLIAMIHFNIRTVYIRGIFTHAEYNQLIKNGALQKI